MRNSVLLVAALSVTLPPALSGAGDQCSFEMTESQLLERELRSLVVAYEMVRAEGWETAVVANLDCDALSHLGFRFRQVACHCQVSRPGAALGAKEWLGLTVLGLVWHGRDRVRVTMHVSFVGQGIPTPLFEYDVQRRGSGWRIVSWRDVGSKM